MKAITVSTRKITNNTCAIDADAPAMPPNAKGGGDDRQYEECKRPTKHALLLPYPVRCSVERKLWNAVPVRKGMELRCTGER